MYVYTDINTQIFVFIQNYYHSCNSYINTHISVSYQSRLLILILPIAVAFVLFKTALSVFLVNVNLYPRPYVPFFGVQQIQK